MKTPILYKILLVDPDESSRLLIKNDLTTKGFEVSACADSNQAMELYRGFLPDLLLTTSVLPDDNGVNLARQIRILDQKVKIIVIADQTDRFAYSAIIHGADCVVEKPFNFVTMREKLGFLQSS